MSALKPVRRWLVAVMALGLLPMVAVPVAQAGTSAPCRVWNVTQDTTGRSLVRMVERAVAGDRLHVRGTCVGGVVVAVDLSLVGMGAGATLSGDGRDRVLHVRAGARVVLTGLTLERGAARRGGGILNQGSLDLRRSRLLRNRAGPNNDCHLLDPTCVNRRTYINAGGGIHNEGRLVVSDTRVSDNKAGTGGGLYNSGTMVIRRSTVSHNLASQWDLSSGGGITNVGRLEVRRSTIAWNDAAGAENTALGGGIFNLGSLAISASTISRNVVHGGNGGGYGAGIANGSAGFDSECDSGDVTMTASTVTRNLSRDFDVREGSGLTTDSARWCDEHGTFTVSSSLIAGNGRGDCFGTFTSGGHNLIGAKGRSCTGFARGVAHDRVGTPATPIDPKLGPLAINGGSTRTHALLPGSPAIDHAGAAPCATTWDQRGVRRPQGSRCDIGAFERR
jgi:hypothetical protein